MHRPHRAFAASLAVLTLALSAAVPAHAVPARAAAPGSAGAGDPYFPRQGNGGYDVDHYRLVLNYEPSGHRLTGVATIYARATATLSRFDLDLRPDMHASSVLVDGHMARYAQPWKQKQELVITPTTALHQGHRFVTQVRYSGAATSVTDPDGAPDGWIRTSDGAFVANEPQGAPTWFPVDDSPRDKATYTVQITVPSGLAAISNGRLLSRSTKSGHTTWTWKLSRKVSSYLVTATIGRFSVRTGKTGRGVPYLIAVDPSVQKASAAVLRKLPAVVDWLSRTYGPYPFGTTGAIVDNAPFVGYALETATRPEFDRAPDELTLAHELAHQWFGDTVTLERWRDIWLNEGFAEFSDWLWDEHRGGTSAHQHLRQLLARSSSDPVWNPPPANPGSAKDIFDDSVYTRGAGALQALRETVGNRTFFSIMRGWVSQHRYGNATVPQFTAYASKVAHRDLSHFFYVWLYRSGKP